MKVDQELCQNEPEKYKLCMPHLCVRKEDPCHSSYTDSVSHDVPIALIIGLTVGSLLFCSLLVALIVLQCRRRKLQGDYHKTDLQRFSSAIALNDCDADPESPHHKVNSSKLKPHLPKHGYRLIPMLSSFPKVHKGFMSPSKNGSNRRNSSSSLSSNPNCGGRRSSDLTRSNGSSPIVMSPAAAAARHQYRLVPDADMPLRIYKNPAAMTNSPKTNNKNKKTVTNNKNIQMSMLARIT